MQSYWPVCSLVCLLLYNTIWMPYKRRQSNFVPMFWSHCLQSKIRECPPRLYSWLIRGLSWGGIIKEQKRWGTTTTSFCLSLDIDLDQNEKRLRCVNPIRPFLKSWIIFCARETYNTHLNRVVSNCPSFPFECSRLGRKVRQWKEWCLILRCSVYGCLLRGVYVLLLTVESRLAALYRRVCEWTASPLNEEIRRERQ